MISKKSFETVANIMATVIFDRYCKELDRRFELAFNKAFEGERVSVERKQRIVNRFINKIHEVSKNENI